MMHRIPVVWHVLYDESVPTSKLSSAAIDLEMEYMNQWFSGSNERHADTTSYFLSETATNEEFNIQFELAAFD